jgi:hypothetical protein
MLLGLLVALMSLGIAAIFGILALVMSSMKSSDAAKEAMARARSNPAVAQQLGTPIEEAWFVSGSISVSSGSGNAELSLPISGPKGKGTVYVTAQKTAGVWNYSLMQAAIDTSGDKIDLLAAAPSAAQAQSDVAPAPAVAVAAPVTPSIPPGDPNASSSSSPGAVVPPASDSPAASPAEGIASADGEQAGTRVVITDLKRGGGSVTLKFTIYNDSNSQLDVGSKFNDSKNYKGFRNFSLIHLVDSANKKKYFAVADSDGNCVCSEGVDDIKPKSSANLWAKFPAPPDSVQKISVEIPHFVPMDDVPIK